jgi:C1A family cysteine protease
MKEQYSVCSVARQVSVGSKFIYIVLDSLRSTMNVHSAQDKAAGRQ